MNRWTIKELNETDDLTFAMSILSERCQGLNQHAPLAKKIQSAFHVIEELRDICRDNPNHAMGFISAKEAIFRRVERDYLLEDIKQRLDDDLCECSCFLREKGVDANEVFENKKLIDKIIELFNNRYIDNDYWDSLDFAIEQGVENLIADNWSLK